MEEITLSMPRDDAVEVDSHTPPSPDPAVAAGELRDRLHREVARICKARDRLALTAEGRSRRRQRFHVAMKGLAKSAATEVAQPIADRRSRSETSKRAYAAMMVFIESAAHDRQTAVRRHRTSMRNSIILAIAATLALGTLAAWRGWIALPA